MPPKRTRTATASHISKLTYMPIVAPVRLCLKCAELVIEICLTCLCVFWYAVFSAIGVSVNPPMQKKCTTTQRVPQTKTNGMTKLPAEILLEIFSYFGDHHRFIRDTCSGRPILVIPMEREHVERSTVIRKLTMTSRAMRQALLPFLWKDAEGCIVALPRYGNSYDLYRQCLYLLSNPIIAAHVEILSVDLSFRNSPLNLMDKFIDTLTQLPNLRTLNLLSTSHRCPVTEALDRKRPKFPNIREMIVSPMYPDFVRTCPNLESLTFRYGCAPHTDVAIDICGAGLKRVAGIDLYVSTYVSYVVKRCPKLQEIGLFGEPRRESEKALEHLRRIEDLAVIEIDLVEGEGSTPYQPYYALEEGLEIWKRSSIDILKNSRSNGRKLLRWRTARAQRGNYSVIESGELEVVSPGTTL